MSDGEVCGYCGCYRVHHVDGVDACLGPGPTWDCPKGCTEYTADKKLVYRLDAQGNCPVCLQRDSACMCA